MSKRPEDAPKVWDLDAVEQKMLVGPLPEGAIVSLTGEPGSGKSTFALSLAGEAASKGIPVLILDRENPLYIIQERMRFMNIGPQCATLCYLGGWLEEEAPRLSSKSILEFVKRNPRCLIVIDSQSPFFDGDENDSAAMCRYFAPLRQIAHAGGTILNLHHSGKAETARDFRGSSAFKANLDVGYKVKSEHRDGLLVGLTLQCFKNRFGALENFTYRYRNGKFLKDGDENRDDAIGWVTRMVESSPGIHKTALEEEAMANGFSRQVVRRASEEALSAGLLEAKLGPGRALRLYIVVPPNRHP